MNLLSQIVSLTSYSLMYSAFCTLATVLLIYNFKALLSTLLSKAWQIYKKLLTYKEFLKTFFLTIRQDQ